MPNKLVESWSTAHTQFPAKLNYLIWWNYEVKSKLCLLPTTDTASLKTNKLETQKVECITSSFGFGVF